MNESHRGFEEKPAAIVLYYRNWPGVVETVDRLLGEQADLGQITLVDNASQDGAADAIRQAYPSVNVVEMPENYGYAGALNRALREARSNGASKVLIMTHDSLLAKGAVEAMVAELESDETIGVVAPVLGVRDTPARVFSAGGTIDWARARVEHVRVPASLQDWADRPARAVDWVDGACMLARLDALESVGGFVEQYFLYFEEVDLAIRLQRSGWTIKVAPMAVAWQSTAGMPAYYAARNGITFFRLNAGRRAVAMFVVGQMRELMRDVTRHHRQTARERAKGMRDGLVGRSGPPPAPALKCSGSQE